eukprot:5387269-Prymnesium_polylepis.1
MSRSTHTGCTPLPTHSLRPELGEQLIPVRGRVAVRVAGRGEHKIRTTLGRVGATWETRLHPQLLFAQAALGVAGKCASLLQRRQYHADAAEVGRQLHRKVVAQNRCGGQEGVGLGFAFWPHDFVEQQCGCRFGKFPRVVPQNQ